MVKYSKRDKKKTQTHKEWSFGLLANLAKTTYLGREGQGKVLPVPVIFRNKDDRSGLGMFNTEAESQLLQLHLESQKVDFCLRESRQVLFLQLSKLGDSLDDLDELMKNHQDLEKLVLSQEQNIRNLENLSSNLPDDEDVATNMSLLLARLKSLQADCQVRRRMLEDSSQYLQLRNWWNMMKEQQEL